MMDKMTSPPQKKMAFSPQTESTQEQDGGLDTISIIRKDAITEGLDPDSLIYSVANIIKDPHYQLVKFDKTVFLLHLIKPYTVDLSLFSADGILGIMVSLKKMFQMLKNQGFKKVYGYTDIQAFKQAIERSKLPIKITQTTQQMGNQVQPVYQFEMDL